MFASLFLVAVGKGGKYTAPVFLYAWTLFVLGNGAFTYDISFCVDSICTLPLLVLFGDPLSSKTESWKLPQLLLRTLTPSTLSPMLDVLLRAVIADDSSGLNKLDPLKLTSSKPESLETWWSSAYRFLWSCVNSRCSPWMAKAWRPEKGRSL